MWFSKKSCRCYSLFRQPLVDLWSLILWYVLASQSKTCQETYEDHIRQNFTGEYTDSFHRAGFPSKTLSKRLGRSVFFSCSHIKYFDEKPPAVEMRWFKDGELLHNIPGKVEIFGCRKKPPIKDTKLRIIDIAPSSSGYYTCKLFLLGALDSDPSVFSETFFLNVTGMGRNALTGASHIFPEKTDFGERSTVPSSATTPIENSSWIIEMQVDQTGRSFWDNGRGIAIIAALIGLIPLALFLALLLRNTSCRNALKKKLCSKADKAAKDSGKASGSQETTVEWKSAEKNDDTSLCKDQSTPQKCSEYVNDEHCRQMFPFIGDDEWNLLQMSQVDRNKVKCEVEYSMPIVLGTGNFGHVYRGEFTKRDGTKQLCAVKRLNDGYKRQDLGHFLMEAITMLKAGRHCNVVALMGSVLLDAVSDASNSDDTVRRPPILLMEIACGGNLKNFLQEHRFANGKSEKRNGVLNHIDGEGDFLVGKDIMYKDLVSFAYQAAKGMEHLACCNIIHRDLAARNVLLTSERVIKIADFGLSKHIRSLQQEYYRVHSPSMTPAKWTAPEALWENKFSSKSDVWSYGVLVWEIFSLGCAPYPGIHIGQLYRKLASGYRLDKPDLANDMTYRILNRCWAWEPDRRPDFKDLSSFFDGSLASVAKYIDLNQRLDSFSTTTSTEFYAKGNSELGSDSVFDYNSSMYTARDLPSMSQDSACFTGASNHTLERDLFRREKFTFSELANPLYEGDEQANELDSSDPESVSSD